MSRKAVRAQPLPGALPPSDFPDGGPASQRAKELASEYSWGPNLVPPGKEHAPPAQGGMYKGQTPPCEPNVGVGEQ